MTAGRPSLYTPELIAKAQAYIDGGWKEEADDAIPSIAGLAVHLGISRETVRAWQHDDDKEQFSAMLGVMLAKQENVLLNGGLENTFNGTITKLVLSKHGYSDKVDLDNTSSDGSMSPKASLDTSKLSTEALKEILDASKPE